MPMSMHALEDFAEVAVSTIASSELDMRTKRSAIAVIYDMESLGDCSFTNLRNIDELTACGYTTLFPKDNLPELLKNTPGYDDDEEEEEEEEGAPYWDLNGEHLCVDSGTDIWKQLVAENVITGKAAEQLLPMSYEEVLRLLYELSGPLEEEFVDPVAAVLMMAGVFDDFDDEFFETFFGMTKEALEEE